MNLPLTAADTHPCKDSSHEEEEGGFYQQQIQRLQDESLAPLKEDLVEWLAKTLDIDLSTDSLIDVLDNGVHLCRLAKIIENKAFESSKNGKLTEPLPNYTLKCKMEAKSGSWFARDNSTNFLSWCRCWGITEACLFETEDLVCHRQEKPVIICLLELARLGCRYGLEPPHIIKIEKEIEHEEKITESVLKPPSCAVISSKPENLNLDVEVHKMASRYHCEEHVKRIQEGTYIIFNKITFIRLLNDRHLMVRVGGGWDTLEHFLVHHSPQEIFVFSHSGDKVQDKSSEDQFLFIQAKYKA